MSVVHEEELTVAPDLDEARQPSPGPVVVTRNAGLAALLGGGASGIAIAYLWRASQTGAVLDWLLCVLLAGVAVGYLTSLLDARTPLVVADELGVRIRLSRQWRGLPWDAVAEIEVQPRRRRFGDGRLVFRPHSLARSLEGLEPRSRRTARLNQRLYGGALAVPLGLSTRPSAGADQVRADLEALVPASTVVRLVRSETPAPAEPDAPSSDQPAFPEVPAVPVAPVVLGAPAVLDEPVLDEPDLADAPQQARGSRARAGRRPVRGLIGTRLSRLARGRAHDTDVAVTPAPATAAAPDTDTIADTAPDASPEPARRWSAVSALREPRRGSRAQVTQAAPATALGLQREEAAADPDGAGHAPARDGGVRGLRRPGSVELVYERPEEPTSRSVRPISRMGDPVEPLVIDDFVTEPAYDPVIGPQLTAARTRLGLSVDELADRTRIRPHVIESIEVDDFTPCGGDFYARGHLRTLARVLGQPVDPLVERFDERYATAPINARRVFEAELATGMTGSMRSTVAGPRWGLLAGVVLVLVMAWGVVRLFETEPAQLAPMPTPVLDGVSTDRDRAATDGAGAGAGPGMAPAGPDRQSGSGPGAATRMPVMLVANQATDVVARDGRGDVVYDGPLVTGERMALRVVAPFTVRALEGADVSVRVAGADRGLVGELDEPATRTFTRPPR